MCYRRLPPMALAPGLPLVFVLACTTSAPERDSPGLSDPEFRRSLVSDLQGAPPPPKELFASDEPIRFVLAADFDRLSGDRSQESEERPGRILIRDREGRPVEMDIEIKTRGNFRLKRSTCSLPPLRLDLPSSEPLGTIFDGQDKLKLVTHCRDRDSYRQNVMEEYLAYRIYNQLTDLSFRVQLAEITYVDTSGKEGPLTRMGFLLEDEDALAERTGGLMLEGRGAGPESFHGETIGTMYLFQYLIGNVDWSTVGPHNVKILRVEFDHFPIPYDFDWSGLVDASYAGPNELTVDLHGSVRERVYWGACADHIDYQVVFSRFQEKRGAILGLVDELPELREDGRGEARDYFAEFYRIIDDPDRAQREIVRRCRRGR